MFCGLFRRVSYSETFFSTRVNDSNVRSDKYPPWFDRNAHRILLSELRERQGLVDARILSYWISHRFIKERTRWGIPIEQNHVFLSKWCIRSLIKVNSFWWTAHVWSHRFSFWIGQRIFDELIRSLVSSIFARRFMNIRSRCDKTKKNRDVFTRTRLVVFVFVIPSYVSFSFAYSSFSCSNGLLIYLNIS